MKFVINQPALIIENKLIISDLHSGFEKHIKDLNIKSQTQKMIKNTVELLKENKCNELIILGDIKHSITITPDLTEVKEYLNEVKKHAKIILVKGNHDGGLQNYLNIEIKPATGFKYKKYYFMHGHAVPKGAENCFIISSHLHPVMDFNNTLSGKTTEKVWLKANNLVIMPSFNPLLGGIDVRKSDLGVLKKQFDKKELDIYLLNGLYLGKVKKLLNVKK